MQRTPCLPLLHKRSTDGASTNWCGEHLIAAHYSFIEPERMKGWVNLVGWPPANSLPTYKWSPSPTSWRLSVRQGKFAGQDRRSCHCTMPPTTMPVVPEGGIVHCGTADIVQHYSWSSVVVRTLNSRCWFESVMKLPAYFWDRWPYFEGKLSWNITTTQVNSALHPSRVAKSSTSFGWGKDRSHHCRVCDPIWHVISSSGVVISITNCYILSFTFTFIDNGTVYPHLRKCQ